MARLRHGGGIAGNHERVREARRSDACACRPERRAAKVTFVRSAASRAGGRRAGRGSARGARVRLLARQPALRRARRARDDRQGAAAICSPVGVFVDQPVDEMMRRPDLRLQCAAARREGPDMCASAGLAVIKACRVTMTRVARRARCVARHGDVLLDAHDPVRRGGTGRPVDWTAAAAVARRGRRSGGRAQRRERGRGDGAVRPCGG